MPPNRPAPQKPQERPAPAPAPSPTEATPPKAEPADGPEACLAKLKSSGWEAEPAKVPAAQPACTIENPVSLRRLRLTGDRGIVEFPDAPVVACRFAQRLGEWVSDLAAPLVAGRLGSELKAVRTGPGFECRNRNHAAAGKISAHASGIAVDVAGFDLRNGQHLAVTETHAAATVELLRALRTGACGWFTTILGPGTDPAHATHWHLDILQHGRSDAYRICQ